MKNKDLAIIVNSCDKYEDTWFPFFKLFSIYWHDCPYKIILNTEKKDFNCDFLSVNTIKGCERKKIEWSERLINILKNIDNEYVLFFLDDFFFQSPIKNSFDDCFSFMKLNKDIGVMFFIPDIDLNLWKTKEFLPEKNILEIVKKSPLRINAQSAIWRKSYLLKILLSKENPWEFEKYGSRRSDKLKERVLLCTNLPFDYHSWIGMGYGISGGWLKNNKYLFEKHNIIVDFEKLGWFSDKKLPNNTKQNKILKVIKKPKIIFAKIRKKLKWLFPFLNI